jgi:hypothetical protein
LNVAGNLWQPLAMGIPNFLDHRLGCLSLEEEFDDFLSLGADDAVEST